MEYRQTHTQTSAKKNKNRDKATDRADDWTENNMRSFNWKADTTYKYAQKITITLTKLNTKNWQTT